MDKKKGIVSGVAGLVLLTSLFSRNPQPAEVDQTRANYTDSFQQLMGWSDGFQEAVIEEGLASQRILVLPIEGVIGQDSATYQHETILAAVEQIRQDQTIKAVLLSIDSPGGGVYATREIYDLMQDVLAERDLPVYVSMGATAASGGYYLAALGDKIYASQETITGSIGVIMSGYDTSQLLEKLGVKPVVYKSGEMKDILSGNRESTAAEDQVIQAYIDESFQRFVDVVVDGRQLSEEEVRKLADGRIYSGQQAKENGLIDELGYERDALAALKADFGLEKAQVFSLNSTALPFDSFLSLPGIFGQLGLTNQNSPAHQVNQVIDRLETLDDFALEYRLPGGQ